MSPLRAAVSTLTAVALLGGLGWFAFGSEHLRFRTLRVVGNAHASEAQIRHLADLTLGEPLLALDLTHAAANVQRHPWVGGVEARRVFPDTVVLHVRERQVRALLLLDQLYLVDTEGVAFRKADGSELDHPVITGLTLEFADAHPPIARRIVHDALGILDATDNRAGLREADISEVRFDAQSGYTVALRNGGEVLFGFDPDRAFNRLDALASRGVDLTHPLRIDLGAPNSAVVSPL